MDEETFEAGYDTGWWACLGDIHFQMRRLRKGEIELEALLDAIEHNTVNEL